MKDFLSAQIIEHNVFKFDTTTKFNCTYKLIVLKNISLVVTQKCNL